MSKRLTTEDFIAKSKLVHGDKFSYENCHYVDSSTKLTITCPIHGCVTQTPISHLNGAGCKKCNYSGKQNASGFGTDWFIMKAISVNGNNYNYDKSIYVNSYTKVVITCKKHGDFLQMPRNHLQGHGCPGCRSDVASKTKRSTSDKFIVSAKKVHGERYNYSLVNYTTNKSDVDIICRKHGTFKQQATRHLAGHGCPSCAQHGFNPSKDGYVYFLISRGGFIKVGITNNLKNRIKKLIRETPFEFEMIAKIKTTGHMAAKIERHYHNKYNSAKFTGFDGATEWLKYSPELMSEIFDNKTIF